ncbi:MAG: B12-binding domain-containing radical SAM protein [Oscillospiraceae bacterium]|nr:B12-binding domain-containing radical SAM protein [Oscillospiraceae bacterium]
MYIKLIQPKMRKRPMDTDIKTHMSPPLGLYTIANMFRGEHKVSVENENIGRVNFNDRPDIVGISVTVDTFPRAAAIAKKFRRRGIPVVAGGIHITTAFKTIPSGCFDALCVGAAELTWRDIIGDLKKGRLKPVYRCKRRISGTDIISPAYDMIKKDNYLYCNIIHTSRGCPFRCDFCYNSSEERYYVNRPVDDVIRDIKAVGTKHVMFIDDNFTGNPAWTMEFLKRIKTMKIKWNAAVSIDIAKRPKLLELMKESGCKSLFIGFESINESSVTGVHKIQNRTAEYDRAVKTIHDKGIMINASFVFGLDSDTPDVFEKTLDWIVRNKIETVTSHILTPYPGTKLYDDMRKSGRIVKTDLSLYNTANVVFRPAGMTPEQLYQGYLWIYKSVYSLPCIIKRIPKNMDQIVPYLLFNLFYRKFGSFTDILCRLVTYNRMGYFAEKLSRYL